MSKDKSQTDFLLNNLLKDSDIDLSSSKAIDSREIIDFEKEYNVTIEEVQEAMNSFDKGEGRLAREALEELAESNNIREHSDSAVLLREDRKRDG